MMNEPSDCCKIQLSLLTPVHFIWLIERAQRGMLYFTALWSRSHFFFLFLGGAVWEVHSPRPVLLWPESSPNPVRHKICIMLKLMYYNVTHYEYYITNTAAVSQGKNGRPLHQVKQWEILRESGAYWVHLYSKWFILNTVSRKMHLGLR